MRNLLTVTTLVLAAVFMSIKPVTMLAKGRRSEPGRTPMAVDTSDKITALHLTSITVTIYTTHQSKEYKVTPATKITVNGRPGALSSLATGMDVTVTTAADLTVAATIDAKSPVRR